MPIINSDFQPARGCSNCHVQTLLPRIIAGRRKVAGDWEQFNTPDKDFVELFWHRPHTADAPLLIIFHGLEGSVDSPYAWQMMLKAASSGWNSVVMHFRGCGPTVNKLARAYHSGDTDDARRLLEQLHQQNPRRPLLAVGYSLGGNMLAKLLGEAPVTGLSAAAVVAAPIDLLACADRINQGFSKVYRNHLLGSLKQKMLTKQETGIIHEQHELSDLNIAQLTNFYEFDDLVTAPLHGFDGVDDYYQRASSRPLLTNVNVPLLMIHAADDPFMTPAVIPSERELSPTITYELSQHGGHMGFVSWQQGRFWHWLPDRVQGFLQQQLENN